MSDGVLRESRRLRAATWVLTVLLGPVVAACGPDGWAEYGNETGGYTIEAPVTWVAVEAGERFTGTIREWEVLLPGEIQKTTIQERTGPDGEEPVWAGELRVRVLSNPDGLTLDDWVESEDLTDPLGGSLDDTHLGGEPAKRWLRVAYDVALAGVVAVVDDRIYHLSFESDSENDPTFDAHQQIYERMIASFRLTR